MFCLHSDEPESDEMKNLFSKWNWTAQIPSECRVSTNERRRRDHRRLPCTEKCGVCCWRVHRDPTTLASRSAQACLQSSSEVERQSLVRNTVIKIKSYSRNDPEQVFPWTKYYQDIIIFNWIRLDKPLLLA